MFQSTTNTPFSIKPEIRVQDETALSSPSPTNKERNQSASLVARLRH